MNNKFTNGVLDFFGSIFAELSVPAKWSTIIGSIVLIVVSIFSVEVLTGWNHYHNVERRINVLKDLYELSESGLRNDKDLNAIYEEIVSDVTNRKEYQFTFPSISISSFNWSNVVKFLGGAVLWIALLIAGAMGQFGKERANIILSVITFALFAFGFGYLGVVIPTIYNPVLNCILYPIVLLLIILLLTKIFPTKNKT